MRRSYSLFLSSELLLLRQYFSEVGFKPHAYAYTVLFGKATGYLANNICTCTLPTLGASAVCAGVMLTPCPDSCLSCWAVTLQQ